jgi:predicted metal-dependent phosphoesterase TrpH
VNAARSRGLAGVAVTDHGTIEGGRETQALAPPDLLVIVGAEIYTEIGDIVGLFLTAEIVSRDPEEVLYEIERQGGFAFLPHPTSGHPPIPDSVLDACHGYEALNSRAGHFGIATGHASGGSWHRLSGKARLGNSDAHFASEIGLAYTTIEGPTTRENVVRSLRTGQTTPGGRRGPAFNYYRSQLVRLLKTRDVGMLVRGTRRLVSR